MDDDQISTVDDLAAALDADEGQATGAPDADQQGAGHQNDGDPLAYGELEAEQAEGDPDAAAQEAGQATEAPADDLVVKWSAPDGTEIAAPIAELKAGYLRHADYTQKAQQLGEERRQAAEQLSMQLQQAQQLTRDQAMLMALSDQLAMYQKADWNALFQHDPAEASRLQALWRQTEGQANQLTHGLQLAAQQQQQLQAQRHLQASEEALTVLQTAIPGFGKPHLAAMRETGLAHGFTEAELSQVSDARTLKVLHEAAQWRALQAKKPGVQQQVRAAPPRAAKPGAAGVPPSKIDAAWKQLNARRDVNSLAALLAAQE
ncbi:hypothetical protein [Comamonas terrigena]|uniref:hypothetical protein n=1 Tax=Comamonas terrigena TaxID=32013 RepID=UPI00235694D8|nr:hypothetical protein [Comamonas terrigena]